MAKLRETKTTNSKKTVGLRRNPKRITSEKSLQSLDDSFSKETINPQVKNDTPQVSGLKNTQNLFQNGNSN